MEMLERPPKMQTDDLQIEETITEVVHQDGIVVMVICPETGENFGSLKYSFINDNFKLSENGDAKILAELLRNKYLFDWEDNVWYIYSNGIWIHDTTKSIILESMNLLKLVYAVYIKKIHELRSDGVYAKVTNLGISNNSEDKTNKYQLHINQVKKRIEQINTKPRISHVIEFLKSYISAKLSDFDNNKLHVNCLNGVYDLQISKLIPHSPIQRFRKMIGCQFQSDKKAPYWNKFINTIFNSDIELIHFIQKLCGIWLTGTTDVQMVFFAYGSGANGKSTFFNAIQLLLNGLTSNGEINSDGLYGKIKIDNLLISKFPNSTVDYAMSNLQGRRLVVASELPKNSRINESLIKDLTGGDAIIGRNPYGRPFTFIPNFKLCIFGNSKPFVKDNSHGFWRRLVLIPFTVIISEGDRREQSELMKEFQSELPGILNWAIEGWLQFKSNGLNLPNIVANATKDYMIENDILQEFFDDSKEKFTVDLSKLTYKILSSEFYQLFIDWCDADKSERINPFNDLKTFNKSLRDKGFIVKKSDGNKTFVFCIRDNEEKLLF